MDCRKSLLLALSLPLAIVGCTTPDPSIRMAPPAVTPPPVMPQSLTTNNQTAQVKKTDAEKLRTKVKVLMAKAEETARLANVGADRFSPDGKEEIRVQNVELHKADLRDRARRDYQEVIALDPRHIPAYQGLMHVYLKSGELDRALETISKALEIAPRDSNLLYDQATCYLCRKEWKLAENSLRSALEIDPENYYIKKQLGFTLAREGEYARSVEILARVFHDVPGYAYYQVAMIMKHCGQEQQCKEYLRMAVQINPNLDKVKDVLYDMEHPEDPSNMPVLQPDQTIRIFEI